MKKTIGLLFAAVPLFGIGIVATSNFSANEVKADETVEPVFTGGKKKLLGTYSTDPKSEPQYSKQLSLNFSAMNIGSTWDTNRGENVTVAVIDSGVNIYHEDFLTKEAQGKTITSSNVEQYSILNPKSCKIYDTGDGTKTSTVKTQIGILNCMDTDTYDSTYKEYYSHGTCTASCIGAAVNEIGGTGIAPNVDLLVINCDLYDSSIDVAIRYAVDNGADIISMSFGAYDITDYPSSESEYAYEGCSTSMQPAINYAYQNGVVCVAAAGNENQGSHLSYPASNEHVIGVGALERGSSTKISDFSCWNVTKNGVILENNNADVFAPGYVWTAGVDDKANSKDTYIETQGTSFSCPLTAGAIALYKSINPTATPDEIEDALFSTCYDLGDKGRDATFGYGRVDVENFLTSVSLKNLTVAPTSANLTINADGTYNTQQLTVTFDPDDCDDEYKNGIWVSNNEDIATVDENGLVTPVSGGTTQVGYIAGKGNLSAEATITVTDYQNHPVESIALDKTDVTIGIDKTVQLNTIFTPKYASNKNVTWFSTATSVATVSDTGLVTGKSEGVAIISATSEDGNKIATCTVTVKKVVAKTSTITFNGNGKSDDSTTDLKGAVSSFISSDSDVSFVSSYQGSKTYQGKGSNGLKLGSSKDSGYLKIIFNDLMTVKSVKITSTIYGNLSTTINVSIDSSTYGSLTSGTTETLTKDLSGTSLLISATKRAYINSIEVTYLSEGGEIIVPVTGVSVNPTNATLTVGQTKTITATISPINATNDGVTWSSSNTSAATVDSNGVVTARGVGIAIITAKTDDGNFIATCSIVVQSGGSEEVKVTGVTLSPTTASIKAGETKTLTASVAPSNATNKNVTWSTSNSAVATVNNGVVTAKAKGNATITVTTSDGGYTATCAVTVTEETVEPVKGTTVITFNGSTTGSDTGTTVTIKNLSESSTQSVISSLSDVNKVFIGKTGWKFGSSTVSGSFVLNFKQSLNIKSITAEVGQYYTTNGDAVDGTITFAVGSTTLGTVDSAAGSSKLTKSVSGSALSVTSTGRLYLLGLTIEYGDQGGETTVPVTGVTLDAATASLKVGETQTLTASVAPSNATNKNVTWSSSDPSVATVNNGVVTAVKAGSAVITVTTDDGNKTANCVVTVTDSTQPEVKVTSITANPTLNLAVNGKGTIAYTINPENATNKNVTFECNDTSVATVSSTGEVTAIKAGVCAVTIISQDNSNVRATVVITVTDSTSVKGCGGSVIASSAVVSALALAGAVLLLIRRKKEN